MTPLVAKISSSPLPQDGRQTLRRKLSLGLSISTSEAWSEALIHDLSETGLMFETAAPLEIGETISLDLPSEVTAEARIIWMREARYGCEFLTPISKATVSAALLQAGAQLANPSVFEAIEEVPIGMRPSVEELTAWKSEFERVKGPSGYRLVGFRQRSNGQLIAIVSRAN